MDLGQLPRPHGLAGAGVADDRDSHGGDGGCTLVELAIEPTPVQHVVRAEVRMNQPPEGPRIRTRMVEWPHLAAADARMTSRSSSNAMAPGLTCDPPPPVENRNG